MSDGVVRNTKGDIIFWYTPYYAMSIHNCAELHNLLDGLILRKAVSIVNLVVEM